MDSYMQATGVSLARTVESQALMGDELEPEFTKGIENGLARPHKIRGRKGTLFKAEDMIDQQDQTLLEWNNIEFFVPVKQPPKQELAYQANSLLFEDSEALMANDLGLPKPVYI